jgi:NADH-quinone oxidoreductase subunit M
LWHQLPLLSVTFLIVTFASIGLPGLNGFIGEFLILLGAFTVKPGWTAAAASGVILGAIYMLWMFRRVFFGPMNHPENEKLVDLNRRELIILVPVIVLIVIMGIYPQPFLSRMKPSVDVTLHRILGSQAAPVASNHAAAGEINADGR